MQKVRRPASYPERGSLLGEQANIEEIAQKNNRWRECWLTFISLALLGSAMYKDLKVVHL